MINFGNSCLKYTENSEEIPHLLRIIRKYFKKQNFLVLFTRLADIGKKPVRPISL